MKNKFEKHIHELCKEHEIKLVIEKRMPEGEARAFANVNLNGNLEPMPWTDKKIRVAPIKNAKRYLIALHEVGHIAAEALSPDTDLASRGEIVNLGCVNMETKAWTWAIENARYPIPLDFVRNTLNDWMPLCSEDIPDDHPVRRLAT